MVTADDLRDLRRRIVEVACDYRVGRTDGDAGGLEADFDPMIAEVALVGGAGVGVDVQRVVGAGVHARLAADAVVIIEVDDAVRGPEKRIRRADRHARRVVAVVASHHRKRSAGVGERSGLDVFQPRAVYAERYVVLALARDRAGVASNAAVAGEKEAEPSHEADSGVSFAQAP